MKSFAVKPNAVDGTTKGVSFTWREFTTKMCLVAVPPRPRVDVLIPESNPSDTRHLGEESKRKRRSTLDMHGLRRVVCEQLVDIIEGSPDTLSDGEEDWNLLRRSKEVVEASAGEGKVDSSRNGRAMAKDLSGVSSVSERRQKEARMRTFKSSSVGIS